MAQSHAETRKMALSSVQDPASKKPSKRTQARQEALIAALEDYDTNQEQLREQAEEDWVHHAFGYETNKHLEYPHSFPKKRTYLFTYICRTITYNDLTLT
jgi:hypothetical protein